MSFRFFTRKKLFPGVTLNMSRSGPSLSFGPRGLKHTVGPRGQRSTVGLPGTGLHYSVQHGKRKAGEKAARRPDEGPPPLPRRSPPPAPLPDPEAAQAEEDRAFLRAVLAYQAGQGDAALVFLKPLDAVADARWLAGMIALEEDVSPVAVTHLEAALRHPDALGDVCGRNGITMEIAFPLTPEVTAHIGPDPRATSLALAEAHQGAGDLSAALAILKTLIRQDPADLVVALSLAEVAFEADDGRKMRMGDLVAILEAATPVEGLAWARDFARARALLRSDALPEAIAAYDLVLADAGTPEEMHKLAWYEKALTFAQAGERTRARQELSGLYALDKSFADVEHRLKNRI